MKKQNVSPVDVLSHHLNPKMVVLKDSEKAKVLKEFGIDESMLPKMKITDQVSVALKTVVGDLVKITRNDGTGEYVSYRVIIEG